jgi:hypothetical protein
VTQLLSVLHSIGQNLDNNTQTDVLYLDLAKAFDSVDHTILLEKLRGYGVTGPVQCWCAGYLNDRTQRVVVDGVTSSCSSVTSGVPQGSILGPLLFVLFDLHVKNETEPFLYADDTKLHQIINSLHDCQSLQRSLTNLDNWSKENELCFNATKCEVLTITRKKTPIMFDYTLGDEKLTRVFSEKDLGVSTSATLWELHVNTIISKANKILGVLRRTCINLTDRCIRRTLYLSLVKSQLSYATEVWSPVKNIQLSRRVERVQRRATKWIMMNGELSYKERLLTQDMLPLTLDREIKDLVFMYKAFFGFINVDINNYVSFVSYGRTRSSQSFKYLLRNQRCRTSTFQSSYYNRIVKTWNTICKETNLDTICTPSSFKHLLKRRYANLLSSTYDVEMACTWSIVRDCPCH